MGCASDLKTEGNALFSAGKFEKAIEKYKSCITSTDSDDSLKATAYRNLAQCYLNIGSNSDAIEAATEGRHLFIHFLLVSALELCPTDTKALFRRCIAYENSSNLKEALLDLRKLLQLDPKNKAIQQLACRLESCVISKKDEMHSLDGRVSSMFKVIEDKSSSDDLLSTVDFPKFSCFRARL